MTSPSLDVHIRFHRHPTHPSAVTAHITGPDQRTAHALLTPHGFEAIDEHTLVLARIDREEPYWAEKAAQALNSAGATTEITPDLRKAIDAEWTWADYPMSWCTREEIRQVSDEAQKIHDDISHGRLIIHAHVDDGQTTVAVGTYRDSGTSVYLHGENHLRQITDTFDSPAQAIAAFERLHSSDVRPGPAPTTDTEREAADAIISLREAHSAARGEHADPEPRRPEAETVPAYAADPGDLDAILNRFVNEHTSWEMWRTLSADTTILIHGSHMIRAELFYEPEDDEAALVIASYETPVSDRMWHLRLTATTPATVLEALLITLGTADPWETALGNPVTEETITTATQPLTDAGWKHKVLDGRWIRWEAPDGGAGVQFDTFAAHTPYQSTPATWTLWGGPSPEQPTWTITASPYTSAPLLADLTQTLAHETGQRTPTTPDPTARLSTTPRHLPPAPPTTQTSRTR
ncbi:DUF317 domain-containing protein [Streptomyces sp. NPDC001508]|uniref:DUF317 domain-containing protein n=1 Tax=Streptomyces sp. NPDC001508 TaxID=3154656 RepID=UPI00332424D9